MVGLYFGLLFVDLNAWGFIVFGLFACMFWFYLLLYGCICILWDLLLWVVTCCLVGLLIAGVWLFGC